MHFLKTLVGLSSLAAGVVGSKGGGHDGPPIDENGIRSIPVCGNHSSGRNSGGNGSRSGTMYSCVIAADTYSDYAIPRFGYAE